VESGEGPYWAQKLGNGPSVPGLPRREKTKTLVSGRFRVTDEVDYFRMADGPEVS